MAITYVANGSSVAEIGVGCSGATNGGETFEIIVGGDGGTTSTVGIAGSATNTIFSKLVIPASELSGVTGSSGTWTIRTEVTSANMNLTWSECYICRIDSSNVNQETIGSNASVGVSLGTTGAKSTTVSGGAVTFSAGDKCAIFLVCSNGSMNAQNVTIDLQQNIDSPFSVVSQSLLWNPGRFWPHIVRRVSEWWRALLLPVPAFTRAGRGVVAASNEAVFRKAA